MTCEASSDIHKKLDMYSALVRKWQKKINLISNSTIDCVYERHIKDSIQLCDYIPPETKTLIDFGSGAGFPAMVIAMLRPDIKIYAVESDKKKCAFMREVSRETNTENITIANCRIENFTEDYPEIVPNIITARALSSLSQLIEYSLPLIQKNKSCKCIFPKGRDYAPELAQAQKTYNFQAELFDSKTDNNAKIITFKLL